MAAARGLNAPTPGAVRATRLALAAAILGFWEALAWSGWFYRDVVPSLERVFVAAANLWPSEVFWVNLLVTGGEVAAAMAIGGTAGIVVGIAVGGSRFMTRAYEPFLHYLGPTPKIIFFPVLIMLFGVGVGSKIAMGALSCFFPVALSVAAGMRGIEPVLIRVGRSFGASTLQMVAKVYLPAMRAPVLNGLRLGFGIAVIGTMLAETKLSNKGLGYLIIQSYVQFDMPRMYAVLIFVFALAAGMNGLLTRLAERQARKDARVS